MNKNNSSAALWERRLRPILVWSILIIAFLLRIHANSFGLPAIRLFGFEEDHIVERGMGILLGYTPAMQWPGTTYFILFAFIGGVYFVFTHFHALLANAGNLFGMINVIDQFYISFFRDTTVFYILARHIQAIISAGEVYLTYRIGREMDEEKAGLAGAAILAISPMGVFMGHLVNVDDLMALLLLGSLLMSMRYQRAGNVRHICIAAVFGGLSTASKFNGLFVIVPIFAALAGRIEGGKKAGRVAGLVRLALLVVGYFILGFVIGCPYILTNPPVMAKFFIFDAAARSMLGETTNGWWLAVSDYLPQAMGWGPMLLGIAGLAGMAYVRKKRSLPPLVLVLIYFVAIGRVRTSHSQHILPILPLLCLGVGILFSIALRRIGVLGKGRLAPVLILAFAAMMIEPALKTIRTERLFTLDDTRLAAELYIEKNIPSGRRILLTGYGDPPLRSSKSSLEKQLKLLDGENIVQKRYNTIKAYLELKGGASWNRALMPGDKYPFLALSEALTAETEFSRAKTQFLLADPDPPAPAYELFGAQPAQIYVENYIERTRNGEFDAVLIHYDESTAGPYADLRAAAERVATQVITFRPESGKSRGPVLELYLINREDRNPTPSLPPHRSEGPPR